MPPRLERTGAGRRHADKQKADDRPILIGTRLFMGSMEAACNGAALSEHGITHILSVISSGQVPPDDRFTVKTVHIDDVERADLLAVLPECLAFCSDAVDGGGAVLIHCMSGVSRSAAVAIAFKMVREDVSLETALAALKAARPDVDPNAGFIEQLRQFHAMHFRLDGDTDAHAKYRAAAALRRRSSVAVVDLPTADLSLAKDPGDAKVAESLSHIYRCKGCSRRLFSRRNIITHEATAAPAVDELVDSAVASSTSSAASESTTDDADKKSKKKKSSSSSGKKKRRSGQFGGDAKCTAAVFIEPMAWMQVRELCGQEEGKINCPACFARLGTWAWAGVDCDCGKHVAPAFKITRSKIERQESSVKPSE